MTRRIATGPARKPSPIFTVPSEFWARSNRAERSNQVSPDPTNPINNPAAQREAIQPAIHTRREAT